jgi:glycosyltransferase involved in cell wall biosynthesis
MPIVSIIIPAKNEEKNIKRCLRSIKDIEYPRDDFEVIVVDNGSNDSTVKVSESLGAAVYTKTDITISALRNYGAQKAKGRVLAFLDADCTVNQDWLQNAEKYFGREDVACFGAPPIIPDNATWVQETWYLVRKKKKKVEEVSWLESMNMFIRKDIFDQIDGFDESLITCEDVDISYRLAKRGRILSDSKIVAIHWGEARTVGEFFRKERWRAKGNYQGMFRHGFMPGELPSLILPIYFVLSFFVVLYFLIQRNSMFLGALFFWQIPILGIARLKINKQFSLINYCRLVMLYNVYFLARSMSIVS